VAFPNFELDWDYPSNDPFGNKHWRNKWIWEKVMIKRKGDGKALSHRRRHGRFPRSG